VGREFEHLHFRFQTSVFLPVNNKEMVVYKDIVCNEGNIEQLSKIPVPLYKEQIKMKVLVMPTLKSKGQHLVKV